MQSLLARGSQAAGGPSQAALTAAEAERAVERLRAFDIEEYGTTAWLEQHDAMQQLNLQAHLNAQSCSDEFVKEALVSWDRVTVLVQELLTAEVWRERVLPLLEQHLADKVDSVTAYQLLYQEAALANLLEVVLFHQDACEAATEEALVELCDWCARCIQYLTSEAHKHAEWKERSASDLVKQAPLDELRERAAEVRFGAAQCALTILRYVTDHAPKLSLSVLARIVSTNDTAMTLLPLLERPPWVRRGRAGALEKYIGGAWQAVEPRERHRLTQQDGQVWLLLHNLLTDPAARSKMDMSEARCESLLRLRRHFNELLMDQLPVLRGLQRMIDELAFGVNSAQPMATPAKFIVEQVPNFRASLLARGGWQALADRQAIRQFGTEAAQLSQKRLERMLAGIELMCGLEGEGGKQAEASKGVPETVKVDAYRQVKAGVWEWWSTYNLQLNREKPAEPVSSVSGSGGSGPKSNENRPRQPSDNAEPDVEREAKPAAVKGKRYRLLPLSENLQRALPADGKVTVLYGGHTCEAQLSLPASNTRDTSGLAPALWLTVGGLAGSGLALQLKLKRLDKPCERDKEAGVWYPYVPMGGALAVRDGLL